MGGAFARSRAFRRFSSHKALGVSQTLDSESQYFRSAWSQRNHEELVEEELVGQELDEDLCFFARCSGRSKDSGWVSWCSDERVLCFRFRPVGGWESGATVGFGEDESQGRVS